METTPGILVLHASLILRIMGDLSDVLGRWRAWGGLFNAMALLLFLLNTAWSVARARPSVASSRRTAA